AYSGTGKFFIDPDDGFNPYEHPFWTEWSKRSPFNMSQCKYCEALTICGGGCPHNADLNNGSIWEVDASFCIHAKETLQWLIWDLYEKTIK
ncbi:MAG: SPASM domain-containing protein, partial [bacterium]